MANRLVNAASSAAVLSGNDIGSINATSRAPNTTPAIKPRTTFDMRMVLAIARCAHNIQYVGIGGKIGPARGLKTRAIFALSIDGSSPTGVLVFSQ
jgi:hypothetical protein